jgi:type I restriction enzyme S subunit
MDLWPLPEAWEWKHLGSVAGDTERRNPGAKPDEYFRYVDIASVDNNKGEIRTGDVQSILGRNAPSRARKVIKEQDIVFATTRPYLRNIAVVPKELDGQICSTGFCVVRARSGISLPDYLFYACRSSFFIEQLLPKQRGATYPAVADNDVYDTLLPVPYPDDPARSLETQRRIVARIEALFAELRECRKLHQAVVEDTNRLMDAVLAEVFDGLTNDFPVRQLGEDGFCDIIPGQHILSKDYSDTPTGTGYVTGPADFGRKYPEITKWTNNGKVFCHPGDVLFTVKGSGVGKVNCAPLNETCAIGRQIMALRPRQEELSSDYLFYCLLGRFAEFQALRQGAAIPGVRKEHVEAISVPVPSIATQLHTVHVLNSIQAEIAEMQNAQHENGTLLEEMEQAILAKAFRGEL